jgi:hypothetical protein
MANVRHKIGDAVAEIARQYTDYGKFEQQLHFKIPKAEPYMICRAKLA